MCDPGFQIGVIVRIRVGSNVHAAGDVRQIGRYSSARQRSAHLMTHGTWSRHEYLFAPPRCVGCRLGTRLQLALNPCLVIRWLLGHDDEPHVRVLSAAVFGAGTRVNTFPVSLYADEVGMVGNQIDLAVECGDPERMDHVERTQLNIDGLAHRNVDLVGSRKALRGSAKVLNLPPPLAANNCNRGMQVMMMTVMDWKTGHQFQTKNEKNA